MTINDRRPSFASVERRDVLRAGIWLAGGLSGTVLAGCSTDVPTSASSTGTSALGASTKERPTDKFVPSDTVMEKTPLGRQLALAMVVVEGAIKQFADQAEAGAKGLDVEALQAVNAGNSAKAVSQLNSFLQRKVGTLVVQDLNPSTQVPVIQQAIAAGIFTMAFNMPSHLQLTTSQYEIGKQLAEGTLDYIAKNLNNTAKIAHFNFDYNEAVAPRDKGWREVMKGRPAGVEIVADLPGNPESQERGNELMRTILQKDPTVNVVDGGDTTVLGALAALRAAGRGSDPTLALFGVNGDPQAITEVGTGGPYKATYGFNFAVLGRLVADMSARWLNGLNVPMLATAPAIKIDSAAAVEEFSKSFEDPGTAYLSGDGKYFNLFGNTSYATRNTYFDGKVS